MEKALFRRVAYLILAAFMAGKAGAAPSSPDTISILPKPAQMRSLPTGFTLNEDVRLVFDSQHPEIRPTAEFLAELLEKNRGLHLQIGSPEPKKPAITFRWQGRSNASLAEAYHLTISAEGAVIEASDPGGFLYGAVTLWQLATDRSGAGPVMLQGTEIRDHPRFRWRGLMIDSARHYQSPHYLEQFIDWMAIHKLNVLHWHLTDDQGWRVEIKHYPRLTEIGGWRVPRGIGPTPIDPATGQPLRYGGIYTQDEIRALVAYAQARHVTILPEIDMPGHATAAIAAYPSLGVAPVLITEPSSDWGILPNLLNIDEPTFAFIDNVIGEMADLFPSLYFHVGGDEALKDQWKNSADIQSRMRQLGIKDEEQLQGYFMFRVGEILRKHGRKMIGWDEILQGGIAPNATVMSWRGIMGAVTAAKAGFDAILAPHPILYLDNRQSTSPGEPPGRGHVVTVEDIYHFDPMPTALNALQRRHILGVQANLWTEHMRDREELTKMAYPRTAALAEIAWSPAGQRDWPAFQMRLEKQRRRYAALGLVDDRPPEPAQDGRIFSQDLTLCSDKLPLSLEDSNFDGPHAIYMIDLMNPCWINKATALAGPMRLTADVGPVPFNFALGKDRDLIKLNAPSHPSGELEVRIDRCDGAVIARLVLPENPQATTLSVPLPDQGGAHDLCFTFTGRKIDPMWAINWIRFDPMASSP
jgi:hexosaminidase